MYFKFFSGTPSLGQYRLFALVARLDRVWRLSSNHGTPCSIEIPFPSPNMIGNGAENTICGGTEETFPINLLLLLLQGDEEKLCGAPNYSPFSSHPCWLRYKSHPFTV